MGDGVVSRAEFQHVMHDDLLKAWLESLDVPTHDLETLYEIMEEKDNDGNVSIDDFVEGLNRMRGAAKSIDIVVILQKCKDLQRTVTKLISQQEELVPGCMRGLENNMKAILQLAKQMETLQDMATSYGNMGTSQGDIA